MNSSFLRSLGFVSACVGFAAIISVLYVFWYEGKRIEDRVAECRRRLAAGDVTGAELELRQLHAQDDAHAGVIELLAEVELRKGNVRGAIDCFKRVPKSAAGKACAARCRAAQLAMQVGDGQASEALAQEALRLDPNAVAPRKLLLRYYFVLLQHRRMCEQSVELDRLGQLSTSDLLMRCIAHRASWDDDEHLAWLEQCLREDPANAQVRAALATHYAARNRTDAAQRVLDDASANEPGAWWLSLARAEQEIAAGRYEVALQLVEGLPAEADGESRVWLARAKVWTEIGDEDAAIVALKNTATLDPYDPTPSYALARILADRGDGAEADVLFQRSQQLEALMAALTRLQEASNPAYHAVAPISVIRQTAGNALRELGFDREADILNRTRRHSRVAQGQSAHAPLRLVALSALASPERRPAPSATTARGIRLVDASQTRVEKIHFEDIAGDIALAFEYNTGHSPFRWLMETLGGGVAVLDFDRDGWDDLYFTQGGSLPASDLAEREKDRLFQNVQAEQARDVTEAACLSNYAFGQGCAVGDFDNDGFPDLAVCNYGTCLLFKNQGDGTFENTGQAAGVASSQWSTSAAFSDLDRDGDLDLYVVQYLDAEFANLRPCKFRGGYTSCRPFQYAGVQDVLWDNLGDGRFADRTEELGLSASDGKGLGVAIVDFHREGRESIFVANDTTANFYFRPKTTDKETPRFQEAGLLSGLAVNAKGLTEACMGVTVGDVDADGLFDLFVTNFQGETNTLYKALGDGQFMDATERAGLADSSRDRLGFGCQFLDIDCDGFLDLFVANGQLHEIPQLPQLYYNAGTGRFREISQRAGAYFHRPRLGRSVARLDWNRDRLPDLAVTYQEGNTSLLENRSVAGNSLVLKCTGTRANRDAVGALVSAEIGERTSYFNVSRGGGYFAANSPDVIVGCGQATQIDQLEVTWPTGRVDVWRDVQVGKTYLVFEGRKRLWTRSE